MKLVGKLSKLVSMQKLKQDIIMLDQQYFILKQVDYESAKYIDNFFLLLFIAALSVFTLCSLMSTALFFFFLNKLYVRAARWPGTENRPPLTA